MTLAYSYLRFSTPDQMKGDSFRRQSELARAYANQHGLELDTELTFHDLGKSAFRGANAVDGALGKFIEAVDAGTVPKGSVLLVENLDRLSRDKIMPALNRFSDLLGKGIVVVTLADGKTYNADSLNNLPDLMLSLLVMARAHEESEMKSKRGKAAWKNKRKRAADGHILTAQCPAWLRVKNGKFVVLPERAAVVERIYGLALEGHGSMSITRKLNETKTPTFGKSKCWYHSYVRKILSTPAVIGTFQPAHEVFVDGKRKPEADGEPIEEYFPPVIDKATFYRVKRSRPGVSGRKGKPPANILAGLVRCAKCDSAMHYCGKGSNRKSYLFCDNARRKGGCDALQVQYVLILQKVLDLVDFPTPWLLGQEQKDAAERVQRELDGVAGMIAELEQKNANLVANLELAPSKALADQLAKNEGEIERLQEAAVQIEAYLEGLSQNGHQWEETKEAADEFNRVMASDDQDKIGAIRIRLNACLKKLIDRVEVGPEGVNVAPRGALPPPTLGREVGKDGSFTFVPGDLI